MCKDFVLDTDTYNEVDDQFALAYLMACEPNISVKAILAAPFFNNKMQSAEDGMELSYREILKILDLCGYSDRKGELAFRGSTSFLPDDKTPVISDAARKLTELSKNYHSDNRLNVIAIGALTNVASAILLDDSIVDRINVVWLGGNEYGFWSQWEFNLQEDIAAARVVFNSRVPVTYFPCGGVVSHFVTTLPELNFWLRGKNSICDYLVDTVEGYMNEGGKIGQPWSKVIWDIVAVAGYLNPDFVKSKKVKAPLIDDELRYSFDENGKNIDYVYEIDRDAIYADMVKKLTSFR